MIRVEIAIARKLTEEEMEEEINDLLDRVHELESQIYEYEN